MALKYAIIPANLLFNRLSPNVAPFYNNLRILDAPQPWPSLPDGEPRRASVNSFGTFESSSLYFPDSSTIAVEVTLTKVKRMVQY